jgi:hypothetical protein
MKKSFFYLTILAGMLFFSLATNAQQARQTADSPKPAEVTGTVLQSGQTIAKPVVSPAVAEKHLTTATDLKPSEPPLKITKANDQQPSSATTPMPADHPVFLKNKQQEIPGSTVPPVPNRIKE